ncbi:MAG: hypothetical protein JW810_14065, partial [Sedimentisphaerales bacterium]|nr:hypothetical protein [Sedimentisphaerales bacterium]
MQEQNRLKGRLTGGLFGLNRWGGIVAILAVFCLFQPGVMTAQDDADELAAQRKKVDELLDTVKAQLNRHLYEQAVSTLARSDEYRDKMSSSQQNRQENYRNAAQQGMLAQQQAEASLQAGAELLAADQLDKANTEFRLAYAQRDYLPDSQVKKIKDQLEVIESRLKQQQKALKQEMIVLFKQSVRHYKNDQYDLAEAGFSQVLASGVGLNLFERGDLTSTEGYLKKIASKREKLAVQMPPEAVETVTPLAVTAVGTPGQPAGPTQTTPLAVTETTPPDVTIITPVTPQTPTPPDQTAPPTETAPPTVVAPQTGMAEPAPEKEKKKFDILGFLKKDKEPEITPEQRRQVMELTALGDQAMNKGNYAQARQYFSQALAVDPLHQPAQAGMAAAEYKLNHPEAYPAKEQPTILDRLIEKEQRQIQYIEAMFTESREKITTLLGSDRFDDARAQATQVLASLDGHKQLLGPDRYARMRGEARGWLTLIDERQKKSSEQTLILKQQQAQDEEFQRQMRVEAARHEKITELFERALKFRKDREYDQAIATLKTLLELDPRHEQAKLLREDMENMQLILRQYEVLQKIDNERQKLMVDTEESAIPWSDKITYPGQPKFEEENDWLALTERRRKTVADITPVDQSIYDKLTDTKVSIDYTENEFSQVVTDFQSQHGLNLNVLWGSLETTAGINRDDTVSLQLKDVPLEKALDSILEYVSSGKYAKAAYTIDQGVITIAAEDDLPERYYVRDYYVADLVGQQAMGMMGMGMGGMGMGGMGMG